jgi:hypothetical protein
VFALGGGSPYLLGRFRVVDVHVLGAARPEVVREDLDGVPADDTEVVCLREDRPGESLIHPVMTQLCVKSNERSKKEWKTIQNKRK